jgi:hypothetical protein
VALEIPEASPQNIVAVVDYVIMEPKADAAACATFADVSPEHAKAALAAAELLGLIESKSGGSYFPADWTTELLAHGSTDQKRQIFRARLERFEPFAYVRLRVLQGFDILQACREAKTRFDLAPAPAVIRDVFSGWAVFARSFVGDPPAPDTSSGIDSPLAAVIDPILDAGATAEEFVSDSLTAAVYVGLDQSVRDKLLLGVRRFLAREEPRSIGQPLGIAFEDFLRGVASVHGIDVSRKNGITEVGTELRKHAKVTKKHLGLIQTVGAIRIAIEHGIDSDEGKGWQITVQGLRLLISTTMLAIKSISSYGASGDLDL